METKRFLTHVNALRGLAILLVFLYHLRSDWCPQGFLGVDAFFVISGYFLVPSLLSKGQDGRFSWWLYYRGKLTRLFPALAVTVLASLAAATCLMLPEDLGAMAETALYALTGQANFYFGRQAVDYFAADVRENVFLHTWYIAVIIQFFVLAPLLLIPLSKLRPVWQWGLLGLAALCSGLIFFQSWLPAGWQAALPSVLRDGGVLGSLYYMTAGRLWEVLAGAFIGLLPMRQDRDGGQGRTTRAVFLVVGMILLVAPAFCPELHHTGFALAAVAGAMLIIRCGHDTALPRLLENRVLFLLGSVSFSLYLVHWPLLALVRYTQIQELTLLSCLGCAVAAFMLTYLLYAGVERRHVSLRCTLGLWLAALLGSSLLSHAERCPLLPMGSPDILPAYGSLEYRDWRLAPRSDWNGEFPNVLQAHAGHCGDRVLHPDDELYGREPVLRIGTDEKRPNFVLLGDSYANALFPGLDIIGKQEGWSGLYVNFYLTPFWGRLNRENGNESYFCTEQKLQALLDWLADNPQLRHVIVMQCWKWRFEAAESWDGRKYRGQASRDFNEQALRTFCQKLSAMGRTPVLMLPTPEANVVPNTNIGQWMRRLGLWYHTGNPAPNIASTRARYRKKMGEICNLLHELEKEGLCTLLDPCPVLFSGELFQPVEGEHLIVWDHDHMTVYGACKLVSGLKEVFGNLFNQRGASDRDSAGVGK